MNLSTNSCYVSHAGIASIVFQMRKERVEWGSECILIVSGAAVDRIKAKIATKRNRRGRVTHVNGSTI